MDLRFVCKSDLSVTLIYKRAPFGGMIARNSNSHIYVFVCVSKPGKTQSLIKWSAHSAAPDYGMWD